MTVKSTARLLLAFACTTMSACFGLFDTTPEPRADGESCDADDHCRSNRCVGGMCTGSSCDFDGECASGFTCADPSTLAEVFSLGLADGACVPTCDVCPTDDVRWSCAGQSCVYDGAPFVDAGGPYEGVVGEPVRLGGSAEPVEGREISAAHWSSSWDGALGDGLEIEAVFMTPGTHTVTLDVEDDEYGYGSANTMVMLCSPQDGPCTHESECCDEVLVCLVDGAGYGTGRCRPPPVCGESWDSCSTDSDCCEGYACSSGTCHLA